MKSSTVVLALCAIAAPLFADSNASRYIVMTRPSAREAQVRLLEKSDAAAAGHDVREFQQVRGFAATLTASEVAQLRRSPYVRFVSPVVGVHLLGVDDTPLVPTTNTSVYEQQQVVPYGVDLVHAREAWSATRGGGNLNVAILDTGIDYTHPDLVAAYRGGYNVLAKTDNPYDDNHHGTHVAGTIAAADNGIGVVGVAPSANLWSIKVLDSNGNGTDEGLVAGVDWVIAKKQAIGGNWIISLSLGSTIGTPAEQEAFQQAIDAGILVVCATGNAGGDTVDYPANYPGVFSVGAVDKDTNFPRFSNHGPRLDVVAPGVSVLSTIPVGLVSVAELVAETQKLDAVPILGAPRAEVIAPVVFCGFGHPGDFPPAVRDNIAVIRRGELSFNDKARNAKAAGARAVIIVARQGEGDDRRLWTLIRPCTDTCDDQNADKAFQWPMTVAVKYEDGEKLLATGSPVSESIHGEDYGTMSGTSMATPHVTGVAALLWSLVPDATPEQIKTAIKTSTRDLGAPGYDTFFGFGLVDAIASAKKIAPTVFGLPEPPPEPPVLRRRSSH